MGRRVWQEHGEVLWITGGYPWSGDGVQGSFHRTAVRALTDLGIPVRVISPVPAAPWPLPLLKRRWAAYASTPLSYWDANVRIDRPRFVAVPSLPTWSGPEVQMARAVGRTLKLSGQVALVHSHYAFPVAPAGRILAAQLGRPHIVTVHGSDINTWPATHRTQLPTVLKTLRSADAVVAVSNALAQRTEELCGRRPDVIPIGIDIENFSGHLPDRSIARQILGLDADSFTALFVGHLSEEKGAVRLADAISLTSGAMRCLIVGDGPTLGYRANDPGQRIRYLGVKSSSDVALLMRAADAVVLPSNSEGLPTVLVEAGAVGTLVIASSVGGIPELIGNSRGLLLEDLSPMSLARALVSAAADTVGTARYAAALRAHVIEHYDVRDTAVRQAALYERVLERGHSA